MEWEFLKFTPRSRIPAMVGALEGVTLSARRPSGTNRMTLWGLASWAAAPLRVMARPVKSAIFLGRGDIDLPHLARIRVQFRFRQPIPCRRDGIVTPLSSRCLD